MWEKIKDYSAPVSILVVGGINLYSGITNTGSLSKVNMFLAGACFSASVWGITATYFRKSIENEAKKRYLTALSKLMDGVVGDLQAELKRRGLEDVGELKIKYPTRH